MKVHEFEVPRTCGNQRKGAHFWISSLTNGKTLASLATHGLYIEIPRSRARSLLGREGCIYTIWQGGVVFMSWPLSGLRPPLVKAQLLDQGRRERMSSEGGFGMNIDRALHVCQALLQRVNPHPTSVRWLRSIRQFGELGPCLYLAKKHRTVNIAYAKAQGPGIVQGSQRWEQGRGFRAVHGQEGLSVFRIYLQVMPSL